MKITAFNGSPQGEKGNTHVMAAEFLGGAAEAGAETENILLARKRIGHCLGCFKCWTATPGQCVIKDDAPELMMKFASSDIVVMATPLYIDNVTGIMKDFMDRLLPLADPHFDKDEGGECRHAMRSGKTPGIVAISNSGFPEQSHFQVLHLLFSRIARNMGTRVIAEIYRGGGTVLHSSSLAMKPLLHQYKSLLRKAGREVARDMKMSEETMARLNASIIPDSMYIKRANANWDEALGKAANPPTDQSDRDSTAAKTNTRDA